jgi:hypothetical protein
MCVEVFPSLFVHVVLLKVEMNRLNIIIIIFKTKMGHHYAA